MAKKKDDMSIESGLRQLTEFFFDVTDDITDDVKKATNTDERSDRSQPMGDDETKSAKRVASPFTTKEKGKADKPAKSSKTPVRESDDGDDSKDGDDESDE